MLRIALILNIYTSKIQIEPLFFIDRCQRLVKLFQVTKRKETKSIHATAPPPICWAKRSPDRLQTAIPATFTLTKDKVINHVVHSVFCTVKLEASYEIMVLIVDNRGQDNHTSQNVAKICPIPLFKHCLKLQLTAAGVFPVSNLAPDKTL